MPGGMPLADVKTFEAAIYNEEVRRLIQEGSKHRDLSDDWADTHYIEVRAADILIARAKIEARYPEIRGYVIEQLVVTGEDE